MNKLFSIQDIFFTASMSFVFIIFILTKLFWTDISPEFVNIEIDGNPYKTLNIDKNSIVELKGITGIIRIEIKNKKVRIINSTCPNQICVKTGWIEKTGDILICLPNKLVVKISGIKEEIDAKSY
ncbi:MAG: NusG domain II-containing protein [Candidatus Firestonebacteria bacterium]|nr:NusG domain II-containing protein [Candidatus Firestonebacteria bacterium]